VKNKYLTWTFFTEDKEMGEGIISLSEGEQTLLMASWRFRAAK
jgi:hypothetical protein